MSYRNCKWCGGAGCLSCEVEADKEYKRQFPDGPKPIATFAFKSDEALGSLLNKLMGREAIEVAQQEGDRRAEQQVAANPGIESLVRAPREVVVKALAHEHTIAALTENIIRAGDKPSDPYDIGFL